MTISFQQTDTSAPNAIGAFGTGASSATAPAASIQMTVGGTAGSTTHGTTLSGTTNQYGVMWETGSGSLNSFVGQDITPGVNWTVPLHVGTIGFGTPVWTDCYVILIDNTGAVRQQLGHASALNLTLSTGVTTANVNISSVGPTINTGDRVVVLLIFSAGGSGAGFQFTSDQIITGSIGALPGQPPPFFAISQDSGQSVQIAMLDSQSQGRGIFVPLGFPRPLNAPPIFAKVFMPPDETVPDWWAGRDIRYNGAATILKAQGGPLLPKVPIAPIVALAEDTVSLSVPPQALLHKRLGGTLLPRPPVPVKVYQPPDESSTLVDIVSQGFVRRLGGQPSKAVQPPPRLITVPNYRPPDDTLITDITNQGLITQLGGKAAKSVTPGSIRPVIISQTEDSLSLQPNPYGIVTWRIAKPPPLGLRPVIVAGVEDSLTYQRNTDTVLMGGKPSRSVTPQTVTLTIPVSNFKEDELTSQYIAPSRIMQGPIFRVYGWRPPIICTAEDTLSPQRPAEATILGGKPSGAATPATLRSVIVASIEDSINPQLWPSSQVVAGKPPLSITPKPLIKPMVIATEDILTPQVWPLPIVIGGKPSKAVTPPYVHPVVVQQTEDITQLWPPTQIITGKVPFILVPKPLTKPFVAACEDIITPQTWPSPILLGGKPSKAITPVSLRPIVVANTEDSHTVQAWPAPIIIGGVTRAVPPILKPVQVVIGPGEEYILQPPPSTITHYGHFTQPPATQQILPRVISVLGPDESSLLFQPPSLIMAGAAYTVIGLPPNTNLVDVFAPTQTITGASTSSDPSTGCATITVTITGRAGG